ESVDLRRAVVFRIPDDSQTRLPHVRLDHGDVAVVEDIFPIPAQSRIYGHAGRRLPGILGIRAEVLRDGAGIPIHGGEVFEIVASVREQVLVVDLSGLVESVHNLSAGERAERARFAVLIVAAELDLVATEVKAGIRANLVANRRAVVGPSGDEAESTRHEIGRSEGRGVTGCVGRTPRASKVLDPNAVPRTGRYEVVAILVARRLERRQGRRSEELIEPKAEVRRPDRAARLPGTRIRARD